MRPLVSIITVCRNAENTIERALHSVNLQTYKSIEYIIVDGASTDNTNDILAKHCVSISTHISEPDRGIYDALNKGVLVANGALIGFLMADDELLPGAVEAVVSAFKKNSDTDVVCGSTEILNRAGMRVGLAVPSLPVSLADLSSLSVPFPSAFYRKEVFRKFGAFDSDYKISGDYEYFTRLYCQGAIFSVLDNTLARFSAGGLSTRGSFFAFWEYVNICRKQSWRLLFFTGIPKGVSALARQTISRILRYLTSDAFVDECLNYLRKLK